VIQKILAFLKSLFTSIPAKQDPALSPPSKMKTISHIPVYGEESDAVKVYQAALVSAGEDPGPIDGKFLTLTRAATSRLQKKNGMEGTGYPGEKTLALLGLEVLGSVKNPEPVVTRPGLKVVNPAHQEAKKYLGKTEFMKPFSDWLSRFWPKAGLPSYKTIVGTSFAWCGLFVLAMNSEVGLKYVGGAAAAISWQKYGQPIDWKKNGIPEGAVVQINHNKCGSGSGNHVTFADGDCTAQDLLKSGATFPGLGGNQQSSVRRSDYPVTEICAVRWPSELPLPGPVTQSVNCMTNQNNKGSTR
jgi:hypothetical protein